MSKTYRTNVARQRDTPHTRKSKGFISSVVSTAANLLGYVYGCLEVFCKGPILLRGVP